MVFPAPRFRIGPPGCGGDSPSASPSLLRQAAGGRAVGAGIALALLIGALPLRASATGASLAARGAGPEGGLSVASPAVLPLPRWLLAEAPGQPSPETVVVTEADDGRTLNLRRGELLRVVLSDTAGTGYSWQIEALDRRLLRSEGQRTWQDPGPPPPPGSNRPVGLVGGPLQVSFLFRAVASGEVELVLRHWRPWEGPRSVDRRLRLRLRVVE